ncbi:hypothetical protein [Streptomyces sp. NPDC056061]|uniref:hypothetical protein n=1 Tax=Streptomyces sp. NPDC056061 TaxID=3345700 RepID=UPI0035DB01BC
MVEVTQEDEEFGLCRVGAGRFPQNDGRGRRKDYCSPACLRRAQRQRDGQRRRPPQNSLPVGRSIAEELYSLAFDLLETELSPSYVSRILSVNRTPSWPVVRQMVEVLGGDPLELRALWEIAQGVPPAPQDFIEAATRLNGLLRGLHLAAGCPGVLEVCEQSHGDLDPQTVEEILAGTEVPSWERTGRFVSAVGGYPADIRPQWEAVYSSLLGACDPASKTAVEEDPERGQAR